MRSRRCRRKGKGLWRAVRSRRSAAALRRGASHSSGRIGGTSPGKWGATRFAWLPAGRDSIAGRRSAIVIASRTVGAIWKSAAFSSSPSIVPAAIAASTVSSRPGSSASARRTATSVEPLVLAARITSGAEDLTVTELIGIPSFAPSLKPTRGDMSRRSAHQMIWRIGCWKSSSPNRSTSSTAARVSGSAGKSGGSGWIRSSSRAIGRDPWVRLPSILTAGTVCQGIQLPARRPSRPPASGRCA